MLSAISNKEVVDAFVIALLPAFRSMVDEILREKDVVISELQDNMKLLTTENTVLRSRIDALKVYTRVENLVIKGLPETYSEAAQPPSATESESATVRNGNTTIASVVQFCNTQLNIEVSPMDISIAHRMPKGRSDDTRPIMVRFATRQIRDKVYVAWKALRQLLSMSYLCERTPHQIERKPVQRMSRSMEEQENCRDLDLARYCLCKVTSRWQNYENH